MIVNDSRRQRILLGREIGGGGEATVYQVAGQPDLLAKIYKPSPRPGHERKLAWMQANPPDDPTQAMGHTSIAWPLDLLYNGKGQFMGYLMYYIQNAVPVLEVFNPRRRVQTLPGFDWRYLHRTARNLAVALDALHARGYVVGDLNESNVMVTPTAMVTLIDTDSFQVQVRSGFRHKTYYCPVGKPEYTPPELQGRSLQNTQQRPEHDCFGLGVLVFQLLMDGSHPFRAQWLGTGDPAPIEERISRGAFPYMTSPLLPVAPPRNAPGLDALHPSVADLVRRCFIDGHRNPRKRPTPREWERAVSEAEKTLVKCPNGHYYASHLSACPQCIKGLRRTQARVMRPRPTPARRAPAPALVTQPVASQPHSAQPLARQQWMPAWKGIPGTISALVGSAWTGFKGAVTRPRRGVMGGALVGALVWAAGGAAFGAVGGAIAGVIGHGILWALVWAIIWASGWWAFGEVLGETIGGRALGKRVGIGGALVGVIVGGGLGWAIGQQGIEEVGGWAVIEAVLQTGARAVGGETFEGMVGAALIGIVSGVLVWGATWAIVGTIGGAIGWRAMGRHALGKGFGRVPTKVYGTFWAIAGALEGATVGAILGVVVGAIVGAIVGLMGRTISLAPVRAIVGAVSGAIIGAVGGDVGAEYVGGIDAKLAGTLGVVETIVGFTAGLLVALGGLDLWASGETGISAAFEAALTGLVSGALVGAISGGLVGAISGAIVRATDV